MQRIRIIFHNLHRFSAWLMSLGAIMLMALSAYLMQPAFLVRDAERYFSLAFAVFIAGVLALGVALMLWRTTGAGGIALQGRIASSQLRRWQTLWRMFVLPLRNRWRKFRHRPVPTTPIPSKPSPIRWRWLGIGALFVIGVVQINVLNPNAENLAPFWLGIARIHPYLQGLMLGIGWGICLWALAGGQRLIRPDGWDRRRWRFQRHHYILLAIIILGFVVRVWNLETWSSRFLDEMHYMHAVARIWANDGVQLLNPFSEVTAFSWLYPLGQSITAGLVGTNFSGVRLLSVISGTIQLVAVYWLARAIVPRRTALLATLILATFPPHIHFSKIGINNIADPIFGLLAFGFLVRGLRGGRMAHFVLAGAMLGFTHYFYEGGRLFFSAFSALWLGWLFLFGRRDSALQALSWRYAWRMVASWLIIIAPMYYVWVIRDIPLTPRFQQMSDGAQQALLSDATLSITQRLASITDKLPIPARGLVQMPDTSWFYSGDTGLVLWFIAPFLLLGIAHVFWRWRTVGGSLLWWWLVAILVANAFIVDSIASPRYIVVMGALAILIAIGITHSLTLLLIPLKRAGLRRFLMRLMISGLAFGIGTAQIFYYYGSHLPDYYEGTFYDFFDGKTGRRFVDTNDAILRAVTLPPNTDVHIVSTNLIWSFDMGAAVMYYQRPDMTINHVFPDELDDAYLYALSPFRNQAFFLERFDGQNLAQISHIFPIDMRQSGYPSPYNIPDDSQLWLYFAPATYQVRDGILGD